MRLPFWLQWIVDFAVYAVGKPAREAGAAEAREAGLREAQRQEEKANAAGKVVEEGEDDPRDLRKD